MLQAKQKQKANFAVLSNDLSTFVNASTLEEHNLSGFVYFMQNKKDKNWEFKVGETFCPPSRLNCGAYRGYKILGMGYVPDRKTVENMLIGELKKVASPVEDTKEYFKKANAEKLVNLFNKSCLRSAAVEKKSLLPGTKISTQKYFELRTLSIALKNCTLTYSRKNVSLFQYLIMTSTAKDQEKAKKDLAKKGISLSKVSAGGRRYLDVQIEKSVFASQNKRINRVLEGLDNSLSLSAYNFRIPLN